MKQPTLFGDMQEIDIKQPKSLYQVFKSLNKYRLSEGNGSCKTCKRCIGMHYHNKIYYKCELMGISHSESSDIRLKNVCDKWEKEP